MAPATVAGWASRGSVVGVGGYGGYGFRGRGAETTQYTSLFRNGRLLLCLKQ